MCSGISSLREVLEKTFPRYLRIRPSGLELRSGKILRSIPARILSFNSARTLYQYRKPVCRSLDGIQALNKGRSCAACILRKTCTPQVNIEILYEDMPLRLLLAYTSARNFFSFLALLRKQQQPLEGAEVIITVRDRGRWGEVCFLTAPAEEENTVASSPARPSV